MVQIGLAQSRAWRLQSEQFAQKFVQSASIACTGIYRLALFPTADKSGELYMTVPTYFRRNSEIPGLLKLHYADIPESDLQDSQGFRFTRPLRTILDLIESGALERKFIHQGIDQALERGLITRQQIRRARTSETARKIVEHVLRRAA